MQQITKVPLKFKRKTKRKHANKTTYHKEKLINGFLIFQACSDNPQNEHTEMSSSVESLSSRPGSGSSENINDKRLSLPQTLQQEFALINVNIPNVTVEQVINLF